MAGAKGDVGVASGVDAQLRRVGFWAHVGDSSNVARVGIQFVDAEGEYLLAFSDVVPSGWQWLEFDLEDAAVRPSFKQPERNGLLDQPVKGINVVWLSESSGTTSLTVNALVAAADEPPEALATLATPPVVEPGQQAAAMLVLHNPDDSPIDYIVEYSWQRDSHLTPLDIPDGDLGTDHAAGVDSHTEHDGEVVSRSTLTDSLPRTAYKLPWRSGYTELFQYVDLGGVRPISTIGWQAGDQNWAWKLDIAISSDGETWTPIPSLTGLDVHKKWGSGQWRLDSPIDGRHLRLRYHQDGAASPTIATLSKLSVHDGVADESWSLPDVGRPFGNGTLRATVPARSIQAVAVTPDEPLPTGAYLCAVRIGDGNTARVIADHVFAMPEHVTLEQQHRARIGLNSSTASHASSHQELGIGWVRFENLKWQMVSPEPGLYKFDGVGPWHVHHDEYFRRMLDHNIQTLPYLFETPAWESSAPAGAKRGAHYPPKDFENYGEFVFQVVARYGSTSHPAEVLKSMDKKSGLGLLNTFELWNEPNLNAHSWGHWIGTLPEYYEMFRVGAEAARRADPRARVANAGFAGIGLDLVDQLRTYTYEDGKSPLDFVDVLSVHTYTGPVAPELATIDTNRDRGTNATSSVSHEEQLRRLDDWRDRHRPDMPIWLTETGYDSLGPRGVSERLQAAFNVRNCLIMLASGIDKVFIFREVGDRPFLYGASGLQRNDNTFKPSWFAVANLIRQIDLAEGMRRLPHESDEVRLIGWMLNGKPRLAAWTTSNSSVALGLSFGVAKMTDVFGGVERSVDTAGVMLAQMPIYLDEFTSPSAIHDLFDRVEREEARRQVETEQMSKMRAILLDFGTPEHLATLELGGHRVYTPVDGAAIYSRTLGHGFADERNRQVLDAHWVADAGVRDAVRVSESDRFMLDIPEGEYEVRIDLLPVGDSATSVKLVVPDGSSIDLRTTKERPVAVADVTSSGGTVFLTFTDYADLRLVTFIEKH